MGNLTIKRIAVVMLETVCLAWVVLDHQRAARKREQEQANPQAAKTNPGDDVCPVDRELLGVKRWHQRIEQVQQLRRQDKQRNHSHTFW